MTGTEPVHSGLMAGRKGLIMGVANERSLAWGIATALAAEGAELAFTYQNPAIGRRVGPLAASVGSKLAWPCDVSDDDSLDRLFSEVRAAWGRLDFVVHAIAYSDKTELRGAYLETSRENFRHTLDVSCYSFTGVARRAAELMDEGGSLITLSYVGSVRTIPNYNVMGVAKAALEASVRYLAVDLGPRGIRVNALSPGPMRTLAGSAIADARYVYRYSRDNAPLSRNIALEEVGRSALFLLGPLSSGMTGEVHYVDAGLRAVGIPRPEVQD